MKIKLELETTYEADLAQTIDISIPLIPGSEGPKCFWAPHFDAVPVKEGEFIGDTTQGGSVNFKNVLLNPHGNGTHTECVGHIATEKATINQTLNNYHFIAQLVTFFPTKMDDGDRIITLEQIKTLKLHPNVEALVVRTMPNNDDKLQRNYSGTNPPYFDPEAIHQIKNLGIKHLLIDLPSVDREEDEGKLASHKAFWNYPSYFDKEKTITELIYVADTVADGLYLLNLQIASFEIDASPSKPVLYNLEKINV